MKNVLLLTFVIILSITKVFAQGKIDKIVEEDSRRNYVAVGQVIKLYVDDFRLYREDRRYYVTLYFEGNSSGAEDPAQVYNFFENKYQYLEETTESGYISEFKRGGDNFVIIQFQDRAKNSEYDFDFELRVYRYDDGDKYAYRTDKRYDFNLHLYDNVEIGKVQVDYEGSGTYSMSVNDLIREGSRRRNLRYSIDKNSWKKDQNFSGLSEGTYTVYVKDIRTDYVAEKTVEIQDVEIGAIDRTYNKGTNAYDIEIHLNKDGSGDLAYIIDGTTYNSPNIPNIKAGYHKVKVMDKETGYTAEKNLMLRDISQLDLKASCMVTNTDCSGKSGEIDIKIEGAPGYLQFNGNSRVSFTEQVFVGLKNFTFEGWFKIAKEDYAEMMSKPIGLFGQSNCIEIGFKGGKTAFYVSTDNYRIDIATNGMVIPNDGEWHHIAVRGKNGESGIIECLLDGVVSNYEDKYKYTKLESDEGPTHPGNPISIGGYIWGGTSEDCFEGDIAGVNIWSVYLEDKDLGRTPTGNEPNLVAAYNMEKRNGNKLEATKGETGIIEDGASWYGKCSYEWYKNVWDENAQMSKYILLPDKEENLEQAEEGDYKVKINYEGYSNQTITLGDNTPIHIGLDDNLSVSIGLSEQDNIICEGEDLQVMPLISGGISEKKYIWTCTDEEGTEIIQAETGHNTENEITANLQNGEYIAPKVLKKGNYIYKLEVKSGVCSKQSNKVEIIVHKTISTNRIRRRE